MRFLSLLVGVIALMAAIAVSLTPQGAETAFPGGNGRIVYVVYVGTDDLDLWSINSDGTDPLHLTDGPYYDYDPAVSPDGTKIVFSSNRDTGANEQLYVMDIDGSDIVRLTNNSSYDFYPAWSPDGQSIAFTSDRDADEEIYVMPAAGGAAVRLTNSPGQDDEPAWSPDGSKIAFLRYVNGGEVWVMDADGDNQVSLTSGECCSYTPDWSPDGSKIAFTSYRDGPVQLYTMTGSGLLEQLLLAGNNDGTAAWSPDGSQVAFSRDPGQLGGGYEVWVAGANGSDPHRITPDTQDAFDPSWAPLIATPTPTHSPTPEASASPTLTPSSTPTPTQTPDIVTASPTPSATATPSSQTVIWGDDNCSGSADPVDSLLTLRHDAGLGADTGDCPPLGALLQIAEVLPASAITNEWGDVDCSGAISPVDSLKILRADAGLSVDTTPECPDIGQEVEISET